MSLTLLLLTLTLTFAYGTPRFVYRRSPGGEISPGVQERPPFSRKPYTMFPPKTTSFKFFPSRELTGQGLHFRGSVFGPMNNMNNNVHNSNYVSTGGNRALVTREANDYSVVNSVNTHEYQYQTPQAYGNNGFSSSNGFGTTGIVNSIITHEYNMPPAYGNNGFSSSNRFGSSPPAHGFSSSNGFGSSNNFGSTGTFNAGQEYSSGSNNEYERVGQYDTGYNSGYSGYSQPGIISKHVYVHVPPPELEEEHYPSQPPVQFGPPEKNYKIIFIKAPSPPKPPQTVIPSQPAKEEKTLVYVLVKKPEQPSAPVIQPPAPTTPSKPEVFFIRYKPKKEEINQPGPAYGAPNLGGQGYQGSNQKHSYLPTNQNQGPANGRPY